jgi:PAS domain S-box-containing protein
MDATDETQIDISNVKFEDLFDLEEIQKIQDAFASATGVASIITDSQGRPITRASNFCHLCNDIIRKTEKGLENCYHSDAELGRRNPNGPIMQPCLSGGLWDGGASISVGDRQIANWLIGQVLDESISQESMLDYAEEIGADRTEFQQALGDVTRMSKEQFAKICQALFLIAGQLSRSALQNLQQARYITERKQTEAALRDEKDFSNAVLESLPGVFYLYNTEGRLVRWNQNYATVLGLSDAEMNSRHVMDSVAEEDRELIGQRMQKVFVEGQSDAEAALISQSGKRMSYYLTGRRLIMGDQTYLAGIGLDITERKQAEAEARRLQEQIIEAQRHALQELSTPIIPVLERIIVMPLIGSIDSLRAKDITRSLLAGISQYRAKIVIVDITGVPLVDSGVADHLNKTIQAARLKGAQTIVTGMSDAVAEAIIDLGIDWSNIQTLSDLQTGLMAAINILGLKLSR